MRRLPKIGFPHPPPPTGGPGSFQIRFTRAIKELGYQVAYPASRETLDIILVVGGTAKLAWLWRNKSRGVRVVQRLDGINWRHKVGPTTLQNRMISEIRNWLLVTARNRLADHVVYQSEFVRRWWHKRYGEAPCGESVIYNGVDLSVFKPSEREAKEPSRPALLCVEGNIQDDPVTLKILTSITARLSEDGSIDGAFVCGAISTFTRSRLGGVEFLTLLGNVPRENMPNIYARGHIFVNLDINSACPNAVVEALASGLPVVGFDTGSLGELISRDAGVVVPYGGDPWKLEEPDIPALEKAVRQVLTRQEDYSRSARSVAERRYGLGEMVNSYLKIFAELLSTDNLTFRFTA